MYLGYNNTEKAKEKKDEPNQVANLEQVESSSQMEGNLDRHWHQPGLNIIIFLRAAFVSVDLR